MAQMLYVVLLVATLAGFWAAERFAPMARWAILVLVIAAAFAIEQIRDKDLTHGNR